MRFARSAIIGAAAITATAWAQQNLHFTYLWHLEQPIYWPERQASGIDRYEPAWGTILRKRAGATQPADDVEGIFSVADRIAVYQYRVRDSLGAISGFPEAGAQVSYSGGLIENVQSLGNAGQLGYYGSWNVDFRAPRSWLTSPSAGAQFPRLDIVQFSFHHALLPLLDESAIRKELQLYRRMYGDVWGASPAASRGLFPSEMAFSQRLIPILASEGISWVVVNAEKLSRACADFPVVLGSGGVNTDPPNRADQRNPAAGTYYRQSISRGCAPAEAIPYSLTPRRMRAVDPSTGAVSSVVVVPASQSISWKDGYAPLGLGDFNAVNQSNNPARPMLVVLAHDGDNAWGGGYSYYIEAVPNLVSTANSAGYTATTIEKYLNDHPVPANDFAHVEQGAWVNADGDFGAPQFLNWNWPPLNASGQVDIPNGWHVDIRNWAVITAAQNRVDTAEQIHRDAGGAIDVGRILYPSALTNNPERAWHYFLGGLNSGFMYYGTVLDMENKPAVASNRAMQYADPVIGAGTQDRTAPTVWEVQRFPWNPGSLNFGPAFGYQQRQDSGDFWIWTFAYDVSGVASVTLKYRVDNDGQIPLNSTENDTYAGGPAVGAWQSLPMTRRPFPAGNVYNDPSINFYATPQYIADQYHVRLVGLRSTLIDYYVEAADTRGHVKRSPIQHVYIGGGSTGPVVAVAPEPPQAGQNVTITYNPAGRALAGAGQVYLHHGFNQWQNVQVPNPPMTLVSGTWRITVPVPTWATQLDVVFNNGSGTWDNNGGQDWHFAVQGGQGQPTWSIDGARDPDSILVGSRGGANLWAGIKGDILYVATEPPSNSNDRFLLVARDANPLQNAMWAKAGQVARWDAFLGGESEGGFAGWTDQGVGTAVQQARASVMEGTINLRQELGTMPETIRLALGVYATPNAGALNTAQQIGPPVVVNGNIEANEYLVLRVCDLTIGGPGCCSVDLNSDGVVDFNDYLEFLNVYNANDPRADFNGDSIIDFNDYLEFLNLYNAGC